MGTTFNIIESLYQPGPGYPNPFPNTTGDPNFAANWPLAFGVGVIQQTGQDIVTARQVPQSQLFIASNPMFVSAAEYSGVFISGSSVLIDQRDGRQIPTFGPIIEALPVQPGSWMVCVAAMLNDPNFSGPGTGSLRVNDFTHPFTRFVYLDSNTGVVSFNEGSSSFPWYIASFGLAAAPIPPTPLQLPAATWPDRPTTQISKSDRIYPYSAFSVVPTAMTIPFICLHCGVGSQAVVYRDIRDYSVAVGIPNTLHGGIQKGASFDFVYCGACGYWYRKNDYKRVRNINIVDFGINPNIDPGGNQTTAFLNEPETYEAQANIADDNVRLVSNTNFSGFTDQFERLGYTVIPVATGSNDLF